MSGLDRKAEALLLAARHGAMMADDSPMVARTEIAMAHFALATDEDERASGHLAVAVEMLAVEDVAWRVRGWLARSKLGRRTEQVMPTDWTVPAVQALSDDPQTRALASLVHSELGGWARQRADIPAASRQVQRALELAPGEGHERATALAEKAELELLQNDLAGARMSYLAAIEEYRALGLEREEGRTVAHYALRIASIAPPGTDEPPASWLGRAKAAMGSSATWRDTASLRGGFRAHGRRLPDRAVGGDIATRIDALDESTARLRAVMAASVDEADRCLGLALRDAEQGGPELPERLLVARDALLSILSDSAVQEQRVGGAAAKMVDVVETSVVERDRMRGLLDMLAQIDSVTELERLGDAAAAVCARLLHADRVLLVRRTPEDAHEIIGLHGDLDQGSESGNWKAAVDEQLQQAYRPRRPEASATRSDERPRGPVLVVSLRSKAITGALYADKLGRAGRFNEQDHQLAQIFGDYFTLARGRLSALGAERTAFEQLTTTLDTIRDGVVAIDQAGVIRNMNTAAARMLRMESDDALDSKIGDLSVCEPLWELLSAPRRIDGALVRLEHGSLIVTARPVLSQGVERGVVATLVELDRARQIAQRVSAARPRYVFDDIVGESESLRQTLHVARRAANVDANVLVIGESGTGKEVFAQAIHTGGRRSAEPFIGMNCAAVPRELLEAELFGYEGGAFTGARREGTPGKFETAGGGTLLLDEIGDMPIEMQAKLLRVLQERVVVRLGGSTERAVRARVIATTHRDLDALVKVGRFRHDLLYRLRVLQLELEPLRSREDDVLMLANSLLRRFAKLQKKEVERFSEGVETMLRTHSWPGNIRELANVVEREVSMLPEDALILRELSVPLEGPPSSRSFDSAPEEPGEIIPFAEVKKRAYLRAMDLSNGNVQRAAKALGVSKVTFYAQLRAWGRHPRDRK